MRDVKPEQMPAPSKRFLTLPPCAALPYHGNLGNAAFTSQGGAGAVPVIEWRRHRQRSDGRRRAP
jgi:hypothetical protein